MGFLKGNSKWMSDFQKSWKCGSKMPIATTKKTMGTTKSVYAFKFSNGCAVTIPKCSTGKCVDNASMLKKFVEEFKLPKASTCATLYKLIDEEYGFSCKQSLKSLVGKDVRLSDVCCGTCMKMNKPKKTTPKKKLAVLPSTRATAFAMTITTTKAVITM